MKIILRDVSESVIEIEEPEITIVDKKNSSRSYVINPSGGYIIFSADLERKTYEVEAKMHVKVIQVSIDKSDIQGYL